MSNAMSTIKKNHKTEKWTSSVQMQIWGNDFGIRECYL